MKVCRVSEMRAMDRTAIEDFGICEELLMENAGRAAFDVLRREVGVRDRRFLIVCSTGNNGGDGLVVARHLLADGGQVRVVLLGDPARFRGAARLNYQIVIRLPVQFREVDSAAELQATLADCDVVVDAIFGTGLDREVAGLYREVVEAINRSGKPVVSIDIPSGVNGDTGQVMGAAVHADATVTFGLPKLGNLLYPGYEHCGRLYVSHISFPPSIRESASVQAATNDHIQLPVRAEDGHKGDFGQALFIAGAASYFGAPYFSALSYLRAGGGYSRLACPCSIAPVVASMGPEIVFIPLVETSSGSISYTNKGALLEQSERMDVVVLGPGLSLEAETQQLARELAREISRPLLIDGDGLTAICQDLHIVRDRGAETILTPHLGEMSRLTGLSVSQIKSDRIGILQRTAREMNAVIVLKGAHALVGSPGGRVFVNLSGNSGLATAGSGDVLAGTIAAMHGLGLSIESSARKGVFLHGLAGDLAARDKGEDGLTARDVMDYLPLATKTDRNGLDPDLLIRYSGATVI